MLDGIISNNITTIQSEQLTKIMLFITNIGDKYTIAFFSAILLGFLIYKKKYIKAKIFTITMGAGVILSQALKHLIQRARPENMLIAKDGFSFPSGHSTLAVCFFGMIIYLFKNKIKNKKLRYAFTTTNILLIIGIAFSRLYLNVHWATDVLAGLILGIGCIISTIYLQKNKLF